MVSIIGIQFTSKEENKKINFLIKSSSIVIIVFLITVLGIALNIPSMNIVQKKLFTFDNLYDKLNEGILYLVDILPYIITSIVMVLSLIISIYIEKKEKNPLLLVVLLAGYLTQGIMVMAPYSPLRTTLTSIMFFIIAIGYLCYMGLKEDYSLILPFIIVLTICNFYLGILLLVVYMGAENLKNDKSKIEKEIIAIILVFGISAIANWYQIYSGYKANKKIYNENIARIESFLEKYPTKEEQKNEELYLLLPEDERYGFTAMVGIDWIDEAIKKYFEIDDSVILVEENIKAEN